MASPLEVLAA